MSFFECTFPVALIIVVFSFVYKWKKHKNMRYFVHDSENDTNSFGFFNVIDYGKNGCKTAKIHKNNDKTTCKKHKKYRKIINDTSLVYYIIIRKMTHN